MKVNTMKEFVLAVNASLETEYWRCKTFYKTGLQCLERMAYLYVLLKCNIA